MKCPKCGKDIMFLWKCDVCGATSCHHPECQRKELGNTGCNDGTTCFVCKKGKMRKVK